MRLPQNNSSDDPFKTLWGLGFTRLVPIIPPGAPISGRSNLAARIAKGEDLGALRFDRKADRGCREVRPEPIKPTKPTWSAAARRRFAFQGLQSFCGWIVKQRCTV